MGNELARIKAENEHEYKKMCEENRHEEKTLEVGLTTRKEAYKAETERIFGSYSLQTKRAIDSYKLETERAALASRQGLELDTEFYQRQVEFGDTPRNLMNITGRDSDPLDED